eukprot:m.276313 g.276313  ORF g.276313 m.276313 type:complete len:844 (+) comp16299_c0_seq7:55-2586(+)
MTMKFIAILFVLLPAVTGNYHIAPQGYVGAQGPEFDGVGGLSGGGGCSRLLRDYNEPYRSQVLDYLFLPNFGASLSILKVEIGGDAQSTDGTEASHRHTKDETPNFNRGYEWWLMKEAKQRNPDIKLYALPWAWPGWLRNSTNDKNPLQSNPQQTAQYVVDWISGANSTHGLSIDFVSIWNEMDAQLKTAATYIKTLRSMLDSKGFSSVKIVASDGHSFGDITDLFKNDPELVAAVSIVGAHYPSSHGPGAAALGKKAWSSEDYSQESDKPVGGMCWARVINQNFVAGNLTASIAWNLVDSYYDGLPFSNKGLMRANHPWSGYYEVDSPIWASAHTAQFAKPGWRYSLQGQGSGWLKHGGSYVTLTAPTTTKDSIDSVNFAIVVEKMIPSESKCEWEGEANNTVPTSELATFQLLSTYTSITSLQLWRSNLSDTNTSNMFQLLAPIPVSNGVFQVQLDPSCLYTIATSTAGKHGLYTNVPNNTGFWSLNKSPYSDNFDKYNLSTEAYLFSDMSGSFEIVKASNSTRGNVMRQMVPVPPIFGIRSEVRPISLFGEMTFQETAVSIDFLLETADDSVYIGANFVGLTSGPGVFLHVTTSTWDVSGSVSDIGGNQAILSGKLPQPISPGNWYTLFLNVSNYGTMGSLDGTLLLNTTKVTAKNGWAVIGTGGYDTVQYDNFVIAGNQGTAPNPPGPPSPAPPSPVPPGPPPPPSPCSTPKQGQPVLLIPCTVGSSGWEGVGQGLISLKSDSSLCLDKKGSSSHLTLEPCSGAHQWVYSDSKLYLDSVSKDECLDINMHQNPMFAETYKCNNNYFNGANEKFTYSPSAGQLISMMPSPNKSTECLAVC